MIRISLVVAMIALTSGCGSWRPEGPPGDLNCGLKHFVVEDIYDKDLMQQLRVVRSKRLSDERPSLNVLALSAGGEFGAYGAAFLAGWKSVGEEGLPAPRRDIQIVTGVSTGAILATHAFLEKEEEIEYEFRRASDANIYRKRFVWEYLTANSLLDTSGKDRLIEKDITREVITQVAEAKGTGRLLFIGVVDIDSGRFLRIDMVKLAAEIKDKELRDSCYRAVVGASSAIPVAFAPKFIDGMMLVDGGARRHLFLTEPPKEAREPEVTRRLYSFAHGDLNVGCTLTSNGVLQIAGRTAELITDQGFKDSIRLAHALATEPMPDGHGATQPLFKTYYATAAEAARVCAPKRCKGSGGALGGDQFCNPFMNCVADEGRKDGIAFAETGKWLQFADLNLSSEPKCKASATELKHATPSVTRSLAQ